LFGLAGRGIFNRMPMIDLTDEERAALVALVRRSITSDRSHGHVRSQG
jgi:hypothetical protein